jgi:energy-coupling factor transporter transmembrane protein EcfT
MKILTNNIWGSATGSARRLTPCARITWGLSLFIATMVLPVTSWITTLLATGLIILWYFFTRTPWQFVKPVLFLGLALFLPYFLLIPLIDYQADNSTARAALIPWSVFFKGIAVMQISLYTISTLTITDLHQGLNRLGFPSVFNIILIQIIHQTQSLIHETKNIVAANAIRGATKGFKTALYVIINIPTNWLPRVIDRAQRVANAMELRNYQISTTSPKKHTTHWHRDLLAFFCGTVIITGAVLIRINISLL